MNQNTQRIIELADGVKSSVQIAATIGLSPRYVRKVLKLKNLPRLHEGAQLGRANHQFQYGRRVGTDGYVSVTAPANHPHARVRQGRKGGILAEHRLVMEQKLGRYLSPREVVDHIDGLTLHNAPHNLRLFQNNADLLHVTLAGHPPKISAAGRLNTGIRTDLGRECQPVDSYSLRRKRGEIRLRQILLAMLILGTNSPFLLGTNKWLTHTQIDPTSHSNLVRALMNLYQQWGYSHAQSVSACPNGYNLQDPSIPASAHPTS